MFVLSFFLGFFLSQAHASEKLIEYQKSQAGYPNKSAPQSQKALLEEARKNPIGKQDYAFLKGVTAKGAAGAVNAHKMGYVGQDVDILLLEDAGINDRADIKAIVDDQSPANPTSGYPYKHDHGAAMVSLAHQLAPQANLYVRSINQLEEFLKTYKGKFLIVNASFVKATTSHKKKGWFYETFHSLLKKKKEEGLDFLIIKSAGNEQENLSEQEEYAGEKTQELLSHTLFAGNLRQDHWDKSFSGRPGPNSLFQEEFLWIVADNVFMATGPKGSDQYSPGTGTSGAAAILSGAAAILRSAHQTMTSSEIKESLLESADREIFQIVGDGHTAVLTTDPLTQIIEKRQFWSEKNKGNAIDFADNLSKDDPMLAASVVSEGLGVGGVDPDRAATDADIKKVFGILTEANKNNSLNVKDLFTTPSTSEADDQHRLAILEILHIIKGQNHLDEATLKKNIMLDIPFLKLRNKNHEVDGTQRWRGWYESVIKDTPSAAPQRIDQASKPNPFAPELWGKGELNVKNALIYAQIKAQKPPLLAQRIREEMLQRLLEERDEAARKIQNAWKKNKDKLKKIIKPNGLVIDASLPDYPFKEAEGEYASKPVDEIDPIERLKGMKQGLRKGGASQLKVIGEDTKSLSYKNAPPLKDDGEEKTAQLPMIFTAAPSEVQSIVNDPQGRENKLMALLPPNFESLDVQDITSAVKEFLKKYENWLLVPFEGFCFVDFWGSDNIPGVTRLITLLEVLGQGFALKLNEVGWSEIDKREKLQKTIFAFACSLIEQIKQVNSPEEKKAILAFLYRIKLIKIFKDTFSQNVMSKILHLKLQEEVFEMCINNLNEQTITIQKKNVLDIVDDSKWLFLKSLRPDEGVKLMSLAGPESFESVLAELFYQRDQYKSDNPSVAARSILQDYGSFLTNDQLVNIALSVLRRTELSPNAIKLYRGIKEFLETKSINWDKDIVKKLEADKQNQWAFERYKSDIVPLLKS